MSIPYSLHRLPEDEKPKYYYGNETRVFISSCIINIMISRHPLGGISLLFFQTLYSANYLIKLSVPYSDK